MPSQLAQWVGIKAGDLEVGREHLLQLLSEAAERLVGGEEFEMNVVLGLWPPQLRPVGG